MLVSLTVGKVDAGVAVLLTKDNRLIEFPSVLLPKNINSGSIVDITVSRNFDAEEASASAFQSLQKRILNTYGVHTPSAPILRLRNATQTSLVLEWDPINLATASLKSLSLYRNGSKAGSIPRPLEMLSTKISGLAIDNEYTFHLVLRTSAGTYNSEKLVCRTHKMTDLSGITVTPGILPPQLRDSLTTAVERIGAKLIDTVRIDTTHFVCTEGRGPAWEKAVEMNIPVVRPEWIEGCEREGTIVRVGAYYLNADPKARQIGQGLSARQHQHTPSTASASVSRERTSQSTLASRPASGQPQNGVNAAEAETTRAPTPPPKDERPSKVDGESDADDENTAEENGEIEETEQQSDSSDDKPDVSDDKDAEKQESEKTENDAPPSDSPSVDEEPQIPNGKKNGVEGDMDEVPL